MCAYIDCSYKSARADKAVDLIFSPFPSAGYGRARVRACACVCFRLEAEAVWLDRRVPIKPSLCL